MSFITDGGDVRIKIVGDLANLNKAMADAHDSVTQKFGDISRTAGIAFTAVGGAIVGGLGMAVKSAGEFEQAITNAASVTGKTGDEFSVARDQMSELALTLGQETAFSASEAANAFYDLSSKGFDVASMSVAELRPLLDLAAATQTDLTQSTEIVTATLKSFSMANAESARVADVYTLAAGKSAASMQLLGQSMPVVGTAASMLGVRLEETVSVLSSLYDKGIDAGTAGTSLRNIMLDMTNGTKSFKDALAPLGISMQDIDLKTMGVSGAFKFLEQHGMTAEMAMAAFGKENATVAAAILGSTPAIDQLSASLRAAGGTAKEIADLQLNTLGGQMEILYGSIEALMIPIGQALIPALKDLAQGVLPVVNAMAEWARAHPTLTKYIVGTTAAVGGLMFILGPMLIMLPGLTEAYTMLMGAAGVGGLAGAAGATGGLIALLAGPAGLVALLGVAAYAVYRMTAAVQEYHDALDDLASREEAWAEENMIIVEGLKRHGVEVGQLGLQYKSAADQQVALGDIMEEVQRRQREGLATTGQEAQLAYQEIANAAVASAQEQQSTWSIFFDWLTRMWNSVATPRTESFPGFERGGVLPAYAGGGTVGDTMRPFQWNERGGEIAVAPVGTRILSHGESVAVARDAIAQAMSANNQRGGPTININNPVVRNEGDLQRIAGYVLSALDSTFNDAAGRGGVVNVHG